MKLINACKAIAIAMVLASCGKDSKDKKPAIYDTYLSKSEKPEESKMYTADSSAAVAIEDSSGSILLQSGDPTVDFDKKIIKTAEVSLEVKDFKAYSTGLHRDLRSFGAYIASEEQTQNDGGLENVMSIKVPVSRFEDLMNSLEASDVKVVRKKINTSDITGEVVDTKGRIEAKKVARDKYLDLLKKARNTKEILEIQTEVNSIQEDLESAGNRVNYLTKDAAYSTINLTFFHNETAGGNATDRPTFLTRLKEAFSNGAAVVKGLVLVAVNIWPLLLAAVACWLLLKRWKEKSVKVPGKV